MLWFLLSDLDTSDNINVLFSLLASRFSCWACVDFVHWPVTLTG